MYALFTVWSSVLQYLTEQLKIFIFLFYIESTEMKKLN